MADKKKNSFEEIKPGTNSGKIFFTALFFFIALLFVTIGFWKTILVAALSAVGYFIGSSKDLRADVSKMVNKMAPQEKKVEPTQEDKEVYNNMKSAAQENKENPDKAQKESDADSAADDADSSSKDE